MPFEPVLGVDIPCINMDDTVSDEQVDAIAVRSGKVYVGGATAGTFGGFTSAGSFDNLVITMPTD